MVGFTSDKANLSLINVASGFFLLMQVLFLLDILPIYDDYVFGIELSKFYSRGILILSIIYIIIFIIAFLYWHKTRKPFLWEDKIVKILTLSWVLLTILNFILAIIIVVE